MREVWVLPLGRRLIGVVFPVLVAFMALYAFPGFAENGRGSWTLYIFALPAVLSVIIMVEWWRVSIGFDASGVHFQSLGYRIMVRWNDLRWPPSGRRELVASGGHLTFSPWFALMVRFVGGVHGRRAAQAMTRIPIAFFETSGNTQAIRRHLQGVKQAGHGG